MLELLLPALRPLRAAVRSRWDLALENLVLRHQLGVALRTNPRPRLRGPIESYGSGGALWPAEWRQHLQVVRPEMGDVGTWTNTGTEAHTASADDGRTFDSPVVNPGETYKETFTQSGRYPYHCSFHRWMTGIVTVGA